MVEEVTIPDDLRKIHYENTDGNPSTMMFVLVNDEVAVRVDEGYQPLKKPDIIPREAKSLLSNCQVELVDEAECPDYEVIL